MNRTQLRRRLSRLVRYAAPKPNPHKRPTSGQYGEWERWASPPATPPVGPKPFTARDTQSKAHIAEHLRGTRLALHLLHLKREFANDPELNARLTAALQDRGLGSNHGLQAAGPTGAEDNWREIGRLLKARGHRYGTAYNWHRIGEALEVDKLVRNYVRSLVRPEHATDPRVFAKAHRLYDRDNGTALRSGRPDAALFWQGLRDHVRGHLQGIYHARNFSDDMLNRSLRRQAYREADHAEIRRQVPNVGERLFTPVEGDAYRMRPWTGNTAEYLGYLPGKDSAERYRRSGGLERFAADPTPTPPPGYRATPRPPHPLSKIIAGLFSPRKKRSNVTTAFTHHLADMTGGEALPAHKVETNKEPARGIGANESPKLADQWAAGNRHRDTLREALLAAGHSEREASRSVSPAVLAAWKHNGVAAMMDSEAKAGRHGTARAIGVAAVRRLQEAGVLPFLVNHPVDEPAEPPAAPPPKARKPRTRRPKPYTPLPGEPAPIPLAPTSKAAARRSKSAELRAFLEAFRGMDGSRAEKVAAAMKQLTGAEGAPSKRVVSAIARVMKLSRGLGGKVRLAAYRAPAGGMLFKGVFYPGGQTVPDVEKMAANEQAKPRETDYTEGMTPPKARAKPVQPKGSSAEEQAEIDRRNSAAFNSHFSPARAYPVKPYRVKATDHFGREYHVIVNAAHPESAMEAARKEGHYVISAEEHVPTPKSKAGPPRPGKDYIPRKNRTAAEKIGTVIRGVFGGFSGKGGPRPRKKRMRRSGRPQRYAADPENHAAFHEGIRQSGPEDRLPSLVYADWLEENGQNAHAEIVRRHQQRAEAGVHRRSFHMTPTWDGSLRETPGVSVKHWPIVNDHHVIAVSHHDPGNGYHTYHAAILDADDAHRIASQLETEGVQDADLARTRIEQNHPHLRGTHPAA